MRTPSRRTARIVLGALLAVASFAPTGAHALPSHDLLKEWPTFGSGPTRTFYNAQETKITRSNVAQLVLKWRFPTSESVTASPAVATVNVDGTPTRVVYSGGFDGVVWALHASNGVPLWEYQLVRGSPAPAVLPGTLSVDGKTRQAAYGVIVDSPAVADVDLGGSTEKRVFIAGNTTMVALDAVTGAERWKFAAGIHNPRYHIESSPIVVGNQVVFGMDCNNFCDKAGIYSVDARDGHMLWFFDLESSSAYHPSTPTWGFDPSMYGAEGGAGCGSVWASPAYDAGLGLLYFGSADCPLRPTPSVLDEAVFALDLDGNVVWHWRPREVDTRDKDFGATPNVLTVNGRRVVAAAGKDGAVYLLDAADGELIWSRKLVGGGNFGGFYNSTTDGKRIYVTSGLGEASDFFAVQEETLKGRSFALDARTGNLLWKQDVGSPTVGQNSGTPGIYWVSGLDHTIKALDSATGQILWAGVAGGAVSSSPVVVDGEVYTGSGTGATYFAAVGSSDPFGASGFEFPHPIPVGEFGMGISAFCLATDPVCLTDKATVTAPGGEAPLPPTGQTVLVAQGQELDAYDIDAGTLRSDFVPETSWVNGQTCFIPGDAQGRFVQATDNPAEDGLARPFWGVFGKDGARDSTWPGLGRIGQALEPGLQEPAGCQFDPTGNLMAVDVGSDHTYQAGNGRLIQFFAPDYQTSCVLRTGLSQPGMVAFDHLGRLYVPQAGAGAVTRFWDFPSSASECRAPKEDTYLDGFQFGIGTPIAIAPAPWGGWAVASVIGPAEIVHVTTLGDGTGRVDGVYVGPGPLTGNPFGIGFDAHGNLWYADLGLAASPDPQNPSPFDWIGPVDGLATLKVVPPDGPPVPQIVASGLSYADGLTVVPSSAIDAG